MYYCSTTTYYVLHKHLHIVDRRCKFFNQKKKIILIKSGHVKRFNSKKQTFYTFVELYQIQLLNRSEFAIEK